MTEIIIKIVVAAVALAIGALIGYIYRKNVGEKAIGSAEQKARNLILDAENKSESMKKEAILEAKEEAHRLRSEAERDARERRSELQRSERRLIQKEESLDKKIENIERKEESITNKENNLIEKGKELDKVIEREMAELEKIGRIIKRVVPDAPHETLLALDASTGQNALVQAKEFSKITPVTGIVLTKIDGTARGGVVLAIREELDIPVKLIGFGEKIDDIGPFHSENFMRGLLEGLI